MSKRKHEEHGEEGGAWEIALADLMTTLMVFFLVMWLTSIVEPSKRQAFVDALVGETAGKNVVELKEGAPESVVESPAEETKPPVSTEEIADAMQGVNPKDIEIEDTEEFTKITLHSDSFFESGRANISEKTREQLEKLGETLSGRDQKITITGYTDSIPIENFQFPSNWELSASRAATVARTFIYMGVDKSLITIVGKADNDAVAPNNSPYGRSLNRRVIILVNKKSHSASQKPAAPARQQPAQASQQPYNPYNRIR